MQTREIPSHEWVPFLDEFSRRHLGQPVTVEILGRDVGAEIEARDLPLIGVSVDLKDNAEQIDVIVGDSPDAHVMHAVARPSHLRVATADNGAEQALQIESADGPTTLVRFLRAGEV